MVCILCFQICSSLVVGQRKGMHMYDRRCFTLTFTLGVQHVRRLDGVFLSDMQQTSRKYFLSATFSLVEVLLGSSEWSAHDSGHATTTH